MKYHNMLVQGIPLSIFDRNSGFRQLDNVCGQCYRNALHARKHKGDRSKHQIPRHYLNFESVKNHRSLWQYLITQGRCAYGIMMEPHARRTYVFSRTHQLELSTWNLFRTFWRSPSFKRSEDSAVGSPFLRTMVSDNATTFWLHPTIWAKYVPSAVYKMHFFKGYRAEIHTKAFSMVRWLVRATDRDLKLRWRRCWGKHTLVTRLYKRYWPKLKP